MGSIPYDQTEEQILDIFRSVGPVVNFRLVFDKDSGKSKGFGFVEYHDAETASSAVRNLNNYQIGQRNLKVDFSHETSIAPMFTSKSRTPGDLLPALPAGTPPPPGSSAHEEITKVLMSFNEEQLHEFINEMKSMATKDPAKLTELFRAAPQLSYLVVQAMLGMRMIDNNTVVSLVDRQDAPEPTSSELSPPQQSAPGPASPAPVDPSQMELIRQVMQLTEEQIAALPPDHRQTLNALRERVLSGEIQI